MDREILFRGKCSDSGEWIYGDLYHRNDEVLIMSYYGGFTLAVDPATVGQYTGFRDSDGKRIFEGDVLSFWGSDDTTPLLCQWLGNRWVVKQWGIDTPDDLDAGFCENAVVIGNSHDNPELVLEARA